MSLIALNIVKFLFKHTGDASMNAQVARLVRAAHPNDLLSYEVQYGMSRNMILDEESEHWDYPVVFGDA